MNAHDIIEMKIDLNLRKFTKSIEVILNTKFIFLYLSYITNIQFFNF